MRPPSIATCGSSISGEHFGVLSDPPICGCTCWGFGWENFGVRQAPLSLLCVGNSVRRVPLAVPGSREPRMVAAINNPLLQPGGQRLRAELRMLP